jgi:uncharacterized protein (TIGR02145 family)
MPQDTVTTPGYCWYDNDESKYKNPYGALYNWYAVNTGKLCPVGWHVSSDEEWSTITDYLGGNNIAGKKLKETGETHWTGCQVDRADYEGPPLPDGNIASNETGFSALLAGIFDWRSYGSFTYLGGEGYWWTATLYDDFHPWNRFIICYSNTGHNRDYRKTNGLSVRCVKD